MSADPITPAPPHAGHATTAVPAHAGQATTAVPAHAAVGTTAVPAVAGQAPPATLSGPRLSSQSPGDVVALGPHQLTIERLLYVGGQAEIYVVQGGPAPRAVLKLYTQGTRPKPEVLARWRLLPPSAVVGLLDADPDASPRAWELQAFAEGGPLASGPDGTVEPIRDPARLREVISQAAAALHALHTIGQVVHRDISPDNFLWVDAARTRLVLSDLGSSSVLTAGAARSGTIRGKRPYMAPEELIPMGEGVVIGEAADFYALGILVLTLWAGRDPFVGRESDLLALKSRGAVPFPPDLPDDLRELVEALLLPASIRLDHAGIQRWLAGQPIPRAAPARSFAYPRLTVRPASGAPYEVDSPAALARFLLDEPAAGERFLYAWNMKEWATADAGLVADLTDVVEKEFPRDRAAGRQKAAYLLDPSLPFRAPDGTVCGTFRELVRWLEETPERTRALAQPGHPLWSYLATRQENELRTSVAELSADRLAGKPDAVALVRFLLMQYAEAGAWFDADGTLVSDLAEFTGRLGHRADAALAKLLDPTDPLMLWLDSLVPGAGTRVGRLRTLDAALLASLPARQWVAIVLDPARAHPGGAALLPDDAWQEPLWATAAPDALGRWLDAWWRVAEGGRFEAAALAWLETRPAQGPTRAVAIALLMNDWAVTGRPLVEVIAACFAAQPPGAGRDETALLRSAWTAVAGQLGAIRGGAPPDQQALLALEAAAAFTAAGASARPGAAALWDALFVAATPHLEQAVREAFAAVQSKPNLLAEVVTRRKDLQQALAAFPAAGVARWAAEDRRLAVLGDELAEEEASRRDQRLQKVVDEGRSHRSLPRRPTWKELEQGGSRASKTLLRGGLWIVGALISSGVLLAGVQQLRASRRDELESIALAVVGAVLLGLSAWRFGRLALPRYPKTGAAAVVGLGLFIVANEARPLGEPDARLAITALLTASFLVAFVLRLLQLARLRRHERSVASQVNPALATSVKAASDAVEKAGRDALSERWLMLHALLATAESPDAITAQSIPGKAAPP